MEVVRLQIQSKIGPFVWKSTGKTDIVYSRIAPFVWSGCRYGRLQIWSNRPSLGPTIQSYILVYYAAILQCTRLLGLSIKYHFLSYIQNGSMEWLTEVYNGSMYIQGSIRPNRNKPGFELRKKTKNFEIQGISKLKQFVPIECQISYSDLLLGVQSPALTKPKKKVKKEKKSYLLTKLCLMVKQNKNFTKPPKFIFLYKNP